ncbi:hypothetical protein [Vibrio phage VpKK5]|uniref:hypothetical protein n=1 Tax=Vibrio phage VpKK5 TaxID=1538804 RepID=UPI0004F5AEC6|nr:hypothetical protein VC55_gp21 [Vibrio phage VpKK5]AIM40605.1 hypothetical protein [Vibrio phage VpKK5]
MLFVILYFLVVVLVNIGFSVFPPVELPIIGVVPPVAFAVGLVFVLRDYAQRHVGHKVFWAMTLATVASFLLADPTIAIASAIAFFVGEVIDWLVYTVTKKPFHSRVLISSAIAVPIDTFIFLNMIDFYTVGVMAAMVFSKLVASLIVWISYEIDKAYKLRQL